MNEETADRLKDLVPYIERFRELAPEEQSWLKELLRSGKNVLSAIALLEEIEKESLNYRELGDRLGINWQTARQKIHALSEGGVTIKQERDGRFISPTNGGRPRKLARKAKQ